MPEFSSLVRWWGGRPWFLRWGVVLLIILALWWSSSRTPGAGFVPLWRAFLHNSAHVVAYGLLAAAIMLALRGRLPLQWTAAAHAVTAAFAYGAVDEWHQSWVPGRTPSVADLGADLGGAAIAVLLLLGYAAGDAVARRWLPAAGAAALLAVALATWTPW